MIRLSLDHLSEELMRVRFLKGCRVVMMWATWLCRSRGQIAHEYRPWSHQLAMANCRSLAWYNCPLQPNSPVSCSTSPPPAMLVWHQKGEPAIRCKIINGPCHTKMSPHSNQRNPRVTSKFWFCTYHNFTCYREDDKEIYKIRRKPERCSSRIASVFV